MVDQLQARLEQWRNDPGIAAIFLEVPAKAFCAGGDVQALYDSVQATPGGPCDYAEKFFLREYRLDYPAYLPQIICWGHGIVMGGGLGVMAGCSHRVVTENPHRHARGGRCPVPRCGRQLVPQPPGKTGQFLALTGASINAADAIYTGIADRFISSERREDVFESPAQAKWQVEPAANPRPGPPYAAGVRGAEREPVPGGQVEPHLGSIATLRRRRRRARDHRQYPLAANPGSPAVRRPQRHGPGIAAGGVGGLSPAQ